MGNWRLGFGGRIGPEWCCGRQDRGCWFGAGCGGAAFELVYVARSQV